MNGNKMRVALGVLAFASLAVLNFTQSERSFVNGTLASSDESSSDETSSSTTSTEASTGVSTSSTFVDHTKGSGMANKRCPIWNVSYTLNGSLRPSVSVTCTTGGKYRCEEGTCPHGV